MTTFEKPVFIEAVPARAPRGRPGNSKHEAIAAELRNHPGEWAQIASAATGSLAADITKGRTIAYRPAGAFEGTARQNVEEGRVDIYARFVGDPDPAVDSTR